MTTPLTKKYWLDVFEGWIEARDMPPPQDEEARLVVTELNKLISDIEAGVVVLEMPRSD
jgi:hypothetical protein